MTVCNRMFIILIFCLVATNSAIAQTDSVTTTVTAPSDANSRMTAKLDYRGIPLFIHLPSLTAIDNQETYMRIALQPYISNWEQDVELGNSLDPLFDITPEQVPTGIENKAGRFIADIQLSIGSFNLPMKLIAYKDFAALGRGPAYSQYSLITPEQGNIAIPLSSEVLTQLKSATAGTVTVSNSINPAMNSNGAVTWSGNVISDYLAGHTALQKQKQQALQQASADEQSALTAILAYRRDNLPTEVQNVDVGIIDEAAIPEPMHRVIDRICYKALYPYYRAQALTRSGGNEPDVSHFGPALTKRCIDARAVAAEAKLNCTKSRFKRDVDCACVENKVFEQWDSNNRADRPISYSRRSAGWSVHAMACR